MNIVKKKQLRKAVNSNKKHFSTFSGTFLTSAPQFPDFF